MFVNFILHLFISALSDQHDVMSVSLLCLSVCYVCCHAVMMLCLCQSVMSAADIICFFLPVVSRLCAVLYDDAGGTVWLDISEGWQRGSRRPESSLHSTGLQVSLRLFSAIILWNSTALDLIGRGSSLQCQIKYFVDVHQSNVIYCNIVYCNIIF